MKAVSVCFLNASCLARNADMTAREYILATVPCQMPIYMIPEQKSSSNSKSSVTKIN
jgi:hypothetical protein